MLAINARGRGYEDQDQEVKSLVQDPATLVAEGYDLSQFDEQGQPDGQVR